MICWGKMGKEVGPDPSPTALCHVPLPHGQLPPVVVPAVVLLLAAQPAAAQTYRPIPPDAKGYQIVQLKQQELQQRYASAVASQPRRGFPATYEMAVPPPEPAL